MNGALLPDATTLGPVVLQVADVDRSAAWYAEVLGAHVRWAPAVGFGAGRQAVLGAREGAEPLVHLVERPGAAPMVSRGRLGLYHVAWLLPDRAALGRFLAHVTRLGVRVGSADHLVSEALYLQDPDHLGVEVYCDRPRAEWTATDGTVEMASLPLDARGLLQAAGGAPYDGLPAGTVIGHVHLHVGDLSLSTWFYRDVLGLAVTNAAYRGAVFLAAGGYHHHLGTNVWAGAGATEPAEGDARLVTWTLRVPTAADVEVVRARADAAGVPVALVTFGDDARPVGAISLTDPWGTPVAVLASRP